MRGSVVLKMTYKKLIIIFMVNKYSITKFTCPLNVRVLDVYCMYYEVKLDDDQL
jgi:hypothetical protein